MTTRQAEDAQSHPPALHQHKDFMKLWAGQGVSMLGSSLSSVALPLVAVVTLNATALQVGLLNFAQTLPVLPLSLFVGVVVDRVNRRHLLIAADIGRGLILGLIPLLAWTGGLHIEVMYGCMFSVGLLSMVFDISYASYTPQLLPQSLLIAANSRLELTRNILSLSGKGIAGAAVTVMRVPTVMAADAVSFFVSALSLALIRTPEPRPAQSARPGARQLLREIREGINAVFSHPYLRPQAINAAVSNFLTQIVLTLFILYATRDLGLSGSWLGLIFAAGSGGGIVGSLLVARLTTRFGYGPAFFGFMVALRAALLCVGLVQGPKPLVICALTVLWFVALLGLVGSNICFGTLRQVAVPDELRGRTNAALNAVVLGVTPLAALLAGVLGSTVGVHATVIAATVLMPLPLILVARSPVRRMATVTQAAPGAPSPDQGDRS